MITRIAVDPDGKFGERLKAALTAVDDLSIPLELIKESWFKSNRAIFALGGPGKFEDLSASYKKQKARKVGFVYPILRLSGRLERALTQPGDTNSVARVIDKRSLTLGVTPSDPIFNYVHFGTRKMKARPFVLLGAEQVAPPELNMRVEAWRKLITDYVIQKTGESFG